MQFTQVQMLMYKVMCTFLGFNILQYFTWTIKLFGTD